ncbi:MAG TPA: ankyrin repeat domain-containing protein [Vicinamibacteria bacterium]|nr:ankyrin repeat domain-containing protein [Vicinamibacteria bacterium]
MNGTRARAIAVALVLAAPMDAAAASAGSLIKRARAAIESGDVDPARDLGPLLAELPRSGGDARKDLISAIEDMGRYDGPSPASVKAYLQQEAPPVLLAVVRGKGDWVVRSDALMVLRSLNASDAFLDEAIALANADTSREAGFFKSRAELLADWKRHRPQPPSTGTVAPADREREKKAIAHLRQRGLGVSQSQLDIAAREGDADTVEALLDAGLLPDQRGLTGSALVSAAGLGCVTDPANAEGRIRTIRLLVGRGADVKAKDEVGNTVLLLASQHCPPTVVRELLDAGAPIDAANQQGMRPLSMAFIGNNWKVAELLVERGARLKKAEVDMVFFELPADSEKLAIIRRATAGAK